MSYLESLIIFLLFSLCWVVLLELSGIVKKILKTVERVERLLRSIGVAHFVEFQTIIDGQSRKVTHMFLKINQKLPVTVVFKDKLGNTASVDGKPVWASTDETLATVTVADDGLSAVLVPIGPVGSLKLQVSADADLGDGVKTILGELAVELISGEAVTVELTAGTPVDVA